MSTAMGEHQLFPASASPQPVAAHPALPGPYASWLQRVAAYLLDTLVVFPGVVVLFVGYALLVASIPEVAVDPATGQLQEGAGSAGPGQVALGGVLAVGGAVLTWAISLWNLAYRQGRCGQSLGKTLLGLKVVRNQDGLPTGVAGGVGRFFLHLVLDGMFYIGYLWPAWDPERRTFTDMVMKTSVVVPPRD